MKNATKRHVCAFTWPLIVVVVFFFLILFAGSAGRQDRGSRRRRCAHPEHPPQELPSAQLFAVHESTLLARRDRVDVSRKAWCSLRRPLHPSSGVIPNQGVREHQMG
jgi:hypothetical protein